MLTFTAIFYGRWRVGASPLNSSKTGCKYWVQKKIWGVKKNFFGGQKKLFWGSKKTFLGVKKNFFGGQKKLFWGSKKTFFGGQKKLFWGSKKLFWGSKKTFFGGYNSNSNHHNRTKFWWVGDEQEFCIWNIAVDLLQNYRATSLLLTLVT